jgi:hypothetical protein
MSKDDCWWWNDIEDDVILFQRIFHLMILYMTSTVYLNDNKNFDTSDDTSWLNSFIVTVNS